MADKKISALTAATTPLAGTEVLPIVQGGSTVKVSVADLTAGRAVSASTLATTGNLALGGATFSAWTVYDPGTVEKTYGAFWASFTDQSRFGLNAYYAFQWVYKQNGFSSQYEQTSGSHKFYTAPSGTTGNPITYTQALTVDQATNNVTANVGNFVVGTSGKGIDFSATPGTGTSELLADYEEGTWTPTIASQTGALTSYSSIGYYTKVGRTITVFGSFLITSVGTAGGKALISNLPFTSLNLPAGPDVIGTGVVREYNATGLTYFVNINDNATTGNICTSLNGAIVWLDTYGYLFSVTYQTA